MAKNNFTIPKYDGAGIYMILNIYEMKAYIGQSKNMHHRALNHKNKLKNSKHCISELNNAYKNNYLYFLIVHKVENANLNALKLLEKIYMLQCLDEGINLYNKQCLKYGTKGIIDNIIFDCERYFNANFTIRKVLERRFCESYFFLCKPSHRSWIISGRTYNTELEKEIEKYDNNKPKFLGRHFVLKSFS